ncbi:MAG: LysR family transcriptional regulator [Ilumatobacteraceae bacterium]|nr:LysR family transcriptional regulator [Ilumatobacteraceae bacterium]
MVSLRDVEIRHLEALDAVATTGTFGRAAEQLGYTQSAISQQIAALERVLGAAVFDRPGGPRPVELTPLGRELLERGRRILTQLDVMSDELARFRSGEVGTLSIGTFQSASATILPLVVGRLRERYPDLELSVFESDHDQDLEGRVESGELDVTFMVGDGGVDVETSHVITDPFVLISRPGQFPPGPVAIADLALEPMIGQHENSCQLYNEAGLRAAGLVPSYVFRSNDNGTVAAMVRAGMGVAVLPLLCVETEDPRLSIHPLTPVIPDRRITVAWRSERTLAPAAAQFIEIAVQVGEVLAESIRDVVSVRVGS